MAQTDTEGMDGLAGAIAEYLPTGGPKVPIYRRRKLYESMLKNILFTNADTILAALRTIPAGDDLVEAIARFVEEWNGETPDGNTFLIAAEIREKFAPLDQPRGKP